MKRLLLLAVLIAASAFAQAPNQDAPAAPPTAEPKPMHIPSGVATKLIKHVVPPEYPRIAKLRNIRGAVKMRGIIGTDGKVKDLQVVSGPEELRAAALNAVRQWRYKPYEVDGKPVEVETDITINFSF